MWDILYSSYNQPACGNSCVHIPHRFRAVGGNSLYDDAAYLTVCLSPAVPQGCASGGGWIRFFLFIPVDYVLSMKSSIGFKLREGERRPSTPIICPLPQELGYSQAHFKQPAGVSSKEAAKDTLQASLAHCNQGCQGCYCEVLIVCKICRLN